jgi:hypothetical protein
MKKLYLFLSLLIAGFSLHAQQVDSISIAPAAPTTADTVKIYIYLSFPNGSCEDVAMATTSGTDIYGYAFHCMGNLSMICYDVDTLVFPPMSAGNYTFYFTLDAGYGPPGNCTPGFQPYDYDTAYFSVSTISGIDPVAQPAGVTVFPNPASDRLTVSNPGNVAAMLHLVNLTGELVLAERIGGNLHEINIAGVAPGTYLYKIVSDESVTTGKLQVIR